MNRPRLLTGRRRRLFAALVATGLAQAGLAALSAGLIGQAVVAGALAPPLAAGLAAAAALAGAAGLAERWLGERLAQDYVLETRQLLFTAAVPAIGVVEDARLLMPFVGDLAAVRNWAARGPAALVASCVGVVAGAVLLIARAPALAPGLAPLLAAALVLALLYRRLAGRIADQRRVRARLTRFVMRRLRPPALPEQLAERQRIRRADSRRLAARASAAARTAVRRARLVGAMEAVVLAAGGSAALAILAVSATVGQARVIAALGLAGFVAARLLDATRALHAEAGGRVALAQIAARLRPRQAGNDPAGSPVIDEDA